MFFRIFFIFPFRGSSASSSVYDGSLKYFEKCVKIEKDEAKCQFQTFSLFGQFPFAGRKTNKYKNKMEAVVKKMIWKEQIENMKKNSKNKWISEDYVGKNQDTQLLQDQKLQESMSFLVYDYDNYPDIVCDLKNTIAYKGKCICAPDYPFGDPYKTGCWGCSISCANGATCISQDFCRCPQLYVGDGIRNCSLHIPNIKMALGRIKDSVAEVIIDEVMWDVPSNIYCKIGYDVTQGTLVSKNKVECKTVAQINSKPIVSLSWDRVVWSNNEVFLEYIGVPWIFTLSQFLCFTFACFIFSYIIFRYYRKIQVIRNSEADIFDAAMNI